MKLGMRSTFALCATVDNLRDRGMSSLGLPTVARSLARRAKVGGVCGTSFATGSLVPEGCAEQALLIFRNLHTSRTGPVPLEQLFARVSQPVFGDEFWTDLIDFFVGHVLIKIFVFFTVPELRPRTSRARTVRPQSARRQRPRRCHGRSARCTGR
jgi:hypothetical protein